MGQAVSAVNVNLVEPYIRALVASTYAQDPIFGVFPMQEDSEHYAETLQMLLNYYWRELGMKAVMKKVLTDALLTGWGWVEYGYQAEFGIEGTPETPRRSIVQRASQIVQQIVGGSVQDERKTSSGQVVEFNEYIKKESVFARRISPFRIICPWDIPDPSDWPWMGYELFIDPEIAKNLPGLKHTDRLNPVSATGMSISTGSVIAGGEGMGIERTVLSDQPSSRKVRIVKIWDKREQLRLIFGDGVREALSETDWPYAFDGFPAVPLIFSRLPETDQKANVFPMSVVEPAIPQLEEMTKLFTHMAENRKRFHTKVAFDPAGVPEDSIKRLSDPDQGGMIPFPGIASNPNLIREIKFNPNTNDLVQEHAILMRHIELIFRISLTSLGTPAPGVDTATESSILFQGQLAQIREMQDTIEDFACEGGRRILALSQQFIDKDIVLQITGDSRRSGEWVNLRPSEIRGEYKVRCQAGSTLMPKEAAISRKQMLDLLNIVFPFQQAGLTSIDVDYMLKRIARTFPNEIPDIDRLFATGIDEERDTARQENELLAQDIPQIVSPRDNHAIHAEEHSPLGQDALSMTKAAAQHIASHAKFMKGAGGVTASAQAARPMTTRGFGNFPDVLQGLRTTGEGIGIESNQTGLGA